MLSIPFHKIFSSWDYNCHNDISEIVMPVSFYYINKVQKKLRLTRAENSSTGKIHIDNKKT